MRSSSGEHYIALDHVRAMAAFMVFSWHFTHGYNGWPVTFGYTPRLFILAPLDEGHTGVALFMTLSGYLFAKLLETKKVAYRAFFWNRFVRLVPLLVFVIILAGIQVAYEGGNLRAFEKDIMWGWLRPTLPNGGWSITVEFHFYLVLPLLIWLARKSKRALLGIVLLAVLLRILLHQMTGEVEWPAYATIVGRIDQFVFGILGYHIRNRFRRRHFVAAALVLGFCFLYWVFDLRGGARVSPTLHSTSPMWILIPTLEGFFYSALIAYYDASFAPKNEGFSWFLGRIGAFSYSIYLFHFFVVFQAAKLVDRYVLPLTNFYVASAAAAICFLFMFPIGFMSFQLIESPFLQLRRTYLVPRYPVQNTSANTVQ